MMDQIDERRLRLGLAWVADDPPTAAARLSATFGAAIPADRAVSIGGLVVIVRGPASVEAVDRLHVVERDDAPTIAAWLGPLAVGWATVDTDRAAEELTAAGIIDPPGVPVERFAVLGASGLRSDDSAFGVPVVLLEPLEEGRLAATLARHGEGPCAVVIGPPDGGPAGLVAGGPVSGPHLLVHGGGYHRGR